MGNTSSCTPTIKVINTNGSTVNKQYSSRLRSVRAAELMHENPGRFVCDSSQLKVGSRIPGLSGDEILVSGRVYFLLSMDLLYSVLTEEEMMSFSSKRRRGSVSKNYFISWNIFCLIPSEAKKIVVEEEARRRTDMLDDCQVSRLWRPALDTIQEVS